MNNTNFNTNTYDGSDKIQIIIDCINNGVKKYANGIVTFEDATKTLFVDTMNGTVGITDGINVRPFIRGNKSIKNDGYVYAVISYHHIDGTIHNDPVGQHRIVGIVSDLVGYNAVPTRPEACHINGMPWDNRGCNIEWGTHGQNARQGKIVASMEHYFPGVYTYKIIKGGHTFICVPQGIYNVWIQEYIDNMCNGKNVFRLTKHNEYIDNTIVSAFADWLYSMKYWK